MEEEKVVLDRKSFEALAVDSRVRILKSLKQRRKTLSELAQEMGMSVSGIKEHLEMLESADLVKKIDDGHKWKYYELTRKGGDLVAPKELRVWVILSIAMVALVISMMALLPSFQGIPSEGQIAAAPPEANSVPAAPMAMARGAIASGADQDNGSSGAAPMMVAMTAPGSGNSSLTEPPNAVAPQQDDRVPFLVGGISVLTLIACLGILVRNRMRAPS